ncbi:ABC-type branched-chain amino acid transport system, substrate-binding protein [Parafrankia irregularis]|uniref:ABC-type branched-chain amino acid transport system, substrate-binding protein n=1 Tax=Parafrankia irregularis TaxID=795642 RepID=A0A0S4QW85_9ACTN|nr:MULTISPECIES: ABC transporter substrate-binding protein [Parafrankia]MBE3201539.1 ABC transporter substrate-binding protein [Parafrankia sp. CH37]CUU59391.1 ABC-type branched-chain amino acid transport system, substrate-binding protein [Parafrankia irregularis]
MRHHGRAALVLSVACAVGVAGCSAGSNGSSAGTVTVNPALSKLGPDHGWSQTNVTVDPNSLACSAPASNPNRGVTATSVKIGMLATATSPGGVAFGDFPTGAKVRIDAANAAGGVNGRTIDLLGTRDDAGDAGRDGAQAKALVEKDQPFAAFVQTIDGNYIDAFCSAEMPFFGWGGNSGFCGNAIGFGITGCATPKTGDPRAYDTGGALTMANALPAGTARTAALIGLDNDSARQGIITVGQGMQAGGFKIVYEESPIPISGLKDATSIVNDIMRADSGKPPAVVFFVAQFGDAVKLSGSLKAAGYKGMIVSPLYDPRVSTVPELEGTYALLGWQGGFATDVPAVAQMVADFRKYSPGTALSLTATAGYWAADMLVKALQKTGENLTVDSFLKTLNTSYTNYVPGTVPETRWPLNHVAPSPCGTLAHLTNGAWSAPGLQCGAIAKAS